MTWPVLTRASEALTDDETVALLRDRIGDGVLDVVTEFGDLTVVVSPTAWHESVLACRDEPLLTFDMFDCLFGVDAAEAGMDVVAILYSTSKGRRIMLRTTCKGGREEPRLATVTDVYPGANWMEREAFDMFGIEFDDHPGLLPRILCVENFEGWPLRKDFALASRVAKPWPGVAEPAETDEDGNIVRHKPAIGEAAGPSGLDEIIARQAREANADPEAIEAGDAGGQDTTDSAPAREEVELDQEVYDDLIAAGKSERIARSKAKAAFIKAQRKAEREAAAAQEPTEDPAAAAEARASAEATRTKQAEARAARASEAAQSAEADATDETPGIPEGASAQPPSDDRPSDAGSTDQESPDDESQEESS